MAETTVTPTEPAGGDGRASRAARTRIAVVDALLALNEKGNLRPTAREIAAEAGVSLRSIYVHFDDVESLLVAAAVRHGEYLISLARSVPTDGPLDRRVAALVANRRTLYEASTGVRRAALVQEPFSPALQRALEAGRKAGRAEIDNVFAAEITAAGAWWPAAAGPDAGHRVHVVGRDAPLPEADGGRGRTTAANHGARPDRGMGRRLGGGIERG